MYRPIFENGFFYLRTDAGLYLTTDALNPRRVSFRFLAEAQARANSLNG